MLCIYNPRVIIGFNRSEWTYHTESEDAKIFKRPSPR